MYIDKDITMSNTRVGARTGNRLVVAGQNVQGRLAETGQNVQERLVKARRAAGGALYN